MKLSHQLWNMNMQNRKFYGMPDTCILCTSFPESIDHIYQCPHHQSAAAHRAEAQAKLLAQLHESTPPSLLQAIESYIKGQPTNLQLSPMVE